MTELSCIVLSAGKSERMKSHKAFLQFSSKEIFLKRIIDTYQKAGIKSIVVVVNSDIKRQLESIEIGGVTFVENQFPERGRFLSLKCGLRNIPEAEFCFVQNIDNPFVTANVIELLLNERYECECIIPVFDGKGGHPVLLSRNVIKGILASRFENFKLNEFLQTFTQFRMEMEDEKILANINTQEEYNRYFRKKLAHDL